MDRNSRELLSRRMPVQALLRVAAIASPIFITAMSWLPFAATVRTGIPHSLEHVLAYFGSSVLAKMTWPRLSTGRLLAAFTLLAAILEFGQLWMPGRAARFVDLGLGLLGVLLALVVELGFDAVRNPESYAVERHVKSPTDSSRSSALAPSLARAGLLSLLVVGALLTMAWVVSLLWATYLLARWLLD